MKRKISIIIAVVICIGIFSFYKYNVYSKDTKFNKNIVLADEDYNKDKFSESKQYYQIALKYKDDSNVKKKIALCDKLQFSYDNYKQGTSFFNKKDYLNAYNSLINVSPEDKKRYPKAKIKLSECANLYINSQISQAKNLAYKLRYQDAINTLSTALQLNPNDTQIINLQGQAKDLTLQYQSKLDEKNKQDAINKIKNIIRITDISTSPPNSAGGVDLNILWTNTSNKTIKYVIFHTQPYNAVGDVVNSEITNEPDFNGRVTGPIAPGVFWGTDKLWSNAWYNNSIVKAKITGVDITYMDDTTETLNQSQIQEVSY